MHAYSLNIATEDKTGQQVPATFARFIGLEWTRHAFAQATKKVPVGSDAYPALYIELAPSRAFLVVDLQGKALR